MDFEVIEEELREQYAKKGKKSNKTGKELQGYIDYCVKRDLLYKRKHKIKLAEAGAMNRVVRMLLGLKAGYTKQELAKPFVVARIVFKPDYSDPQIRKIMVEQSIKSLTSVYGAEAFGEAQMDSPPIDILSENIDGSGYEPENQDDKTGNAGDEPEPDNITNAKADFTASDESSQISTLKILAKRKDYDLKQLKRPLDKFTEAEREGFFDKLMEMPDSDIPF